ncbi:phospholipase D-like domain-containing protein [Hansschlegelia beijingensis]
MRLQIIKTFAAVAGLLLSVPTIAWSQRSPVIDAKVSVCFSPDGRCVRELLREIDGAQKTIRVQAVLLTVKPIVRALVRAHQRGLDVAVILGRKLGQQPHRPDVCERLASGGVPGVQMASVGIPVFIDDQNIKTAHNKITIIDGRLVIGGSFNYTYSADRRNAENMTFTWSEELAKRYVAHWTQRQAASRPIFRPSC